MLFKTKPQSAPETRFPLSPTLFTSVKEGDLHVTRVACSLERAVDLFHALSEHMADIVDLSVECVRTGRRFMGQGLSLPEVREAVARLKVPLVASGGVELTIFTADDQLSLGPMLDLWCYAKTDRWVYLLVAEDADEAPAETGLPERGWRVRRDEFAGAPELVAAVEKAAERLTLRLV